VVMFRLVISAVLTMARLSRLKQNVKKAAKQKCMYVLMNIILPNIVWPNKKCKLYFLYVH
jgi:hypothetical protein